MKENKSLEIMNNSKMKIHQELKLYNKNQMSNSNEWRTEGNTRIRSFQDSYKFARFQMIQHITYTNCHRNCKSIDPHLESTDVASTELFMSSRIPEIQLDWSDAQCWKADSPKIKTLKPDSKVKNQRPGQWQEQYVEKVSIIDRIQIDWSDEIDTEKCQTPKFVISIREQLMSGDQ
jgi:hypothetical protein